MLSEHVVKDHRYRHGGGLKSRRTALVVRDPDAEAIENLPSRMASGRGRQFSRWDNAPALRLTGIERFLKANVGRPWAQVYSDLRHRLNGSWHNVSWKVASAVETHCVVNDDGTVIGRGKYGWHRPVEGVYVCPETGILRKPEPKMGRVQSSDLKDELRCLTEALTVIEIKTDEYYERHGADWYHVTVEHFANNVIMYIRALKDNPLVSKGPYYPPMYKRRVKLCNKRELRDVRAKLTQTKRELAQVCAKLGRPMPAPINLPAAESDISTVMPGKWQNRPVGSVNFDDHRVTGVKIAG